MVARLVSADSETGTLPDVVISDLGTRFPASAIPASTQRAVTAPFDASRSLFNYKPERLRKTRAGLGLTQAGLGSFKILHLGDSNTLGLGPLIMELDAGAYAYAARERDYLRASGFKVSSDGALYPAQGGDKRWVTTGEAGMINSLFQSLDNGATGTFSPVSPCNAFEITYLNQFAGSFTVTIDNGTPITVTRSAAGGFATWRSDFLPLGTHTVKLTAASGGSIHFTSIEAMTYGTGYSGVRISKAGVSGSTAADWLNGQYPYREITRLWKADLVTIMLGTNDAQSSTVSAYKQNIISLVNAYRIDGAEVLLIAPPARAEIDLTPYWRALYDLALDMDLPVLDIRDRQGPYSATGGYFINATGDTAHISSAAHDDLARALLNVIL